MPQMKIAIIGAGLSGCTIARLLKDRGHSVEIYEKESRIGGLCASGLHDGRIYQLFGPHIFHAHSPRVIEFVKRFSRFNGYVHYKGTCIDGRILPYPVSYETIGMLEDRGKILEELKHLPPRPDMTNFETYIVSLMGRTLYSIFIRNYSLKFWGVSPEDLEAEWAGRRIEIRQDNRQGYFKDEWQGLPESGYTPFFEKMIEGIPVHYSTPVTDYRQLRYDLVVSTMPVDVLFNFQHGRLMYRGLRFALSFQERHWENPKYGCINYPGNDAAYIRKSNYGIFYPQNNGAAQIVGYEYPDETEERMYPVHIPENRTILNRYLSQLAGIDNLVSIGRLGLARYFDMDEVVDWCLNHVEDIERYPCLTPEQRMKLLTA